MSVMKSVFQNEWLLLLRNKFLAVPVLANILYWGYVIIAYEIQPIHYEERAAVFYQSFIWLLLLNLFIIGLFAVYMASKDRDSYFEQLVVTYEVKNGEWIVGKWLITQLYGICITMITVVVQALWFIVTPTPIGDWFKNIFYVFMQMEGAFFLLISIGFLFAHLIKSMLAYLAIPAILVLSLFLPFDYAGTAESWDNPKFHLLTPFDFMFVETPYDGIWGIYHLFKNAMLHQSAIILLSVVVIGLALLFFQRKRRSHKEKKLIPILITIFLIPTAVLSGARFMQYDQALHQYIATGKKYAESFDGEGDYNEWMNSFYEEHKDDQPYEFSMEKTNISVELQAEDYINVQSNLKIKHNGNESIDEVFLTLYHGLNIKECTSERTVSCLRSGDFIKLHLEQPMKPNDTLHLSLQYEGNVLQYREDGYVEQAFIKNDRVYLPKEAGWYPLIGKRNLVIAREHDNLYAGFELRNARLVEDFPTEFTVNMKQDQKLPLALTIPEISKGTFQGNSQYGLSLIGGKFKEDKVGEIRVVAHPESVNGMKEVIGRYQQSWSFIEDWLEVQMSPSVIYILSDNYYYLTRDGVNHDFFVMRNEYVDDVEIAHELLNELTRENPFDGTQDFSVFYDALVWILLDNLHEQDGFLEWYKTNVSDEGEILTRVKLLQDYAEKGTEPFKAVLQYLFNYWAGLDHKQEFDLEAALKQYEGKSKQ